MAFEAFLWQFVCSHLHIRRNNFAGNSNSTLAFDVFFCCKNAAKKKNFFKNIAVPVKLVVVIIFGIVMIIMIIIIIIIITIITHLFTC